MLILGFQAGELAGNDTVGGVGDKPGDAVSVGVGEPQLGTGVRAFLTKRWSR